MLVRISPEVDSADRRKLAFLGTRSSTEPETLLSSQRWLALGFPETWIEPEIACTFKSLFAPTTSIEPLAVEASTRSPGRSIRIDPEAALTFNSPFTSDARVSPEALETRKKPPIEDASIDPLAAFSCVSRSTR